MTVVDQGRRGSRPTSRSRPTQSFIRSRCCADGRSFAPAPRSVRVVVLDSEIGPGAVVGPFAYLRPGATIAGGGQGGGFRRGEELDARGARQGATPLLHRGRRDRRRHQYRRRAITANYRPEQHEEKQRTVIGRDVHTSSDNVFVAPVEIGDHAWIAAGSTITEDVPPGALAVARAKQVNRKLP